MPSPAEAAHTPLDDAQGLAAGAILAAFGIAVLTHLGLVTGQTAGLAVLVSYATGLPFGPVFFAVNLPFYWLGWRRIGGACSGAVERTRRVGDPPGASHGPAAVSSAIARGTAQVSRNGATIVVRTTAATTAL